MQRRNSFNKIPLPISPTIRRNSVNPRRNSPRSPLIRTTYSSPGSRLPVHRRTGMSGVRHTLSPLTTENRPTRKFPFNRSVNRLVTRSPSMFRSRRPSPSLKNKKVYRIKK